MSTEPEKLGHEKKAVGIIDSDKPFFLRSDCVNDFASAGKALSAYFLALGSISHGFAFRSRSRVALPVRSRR